MQFSIGEVSKLYDISKDTLRHYDKLGLLKPYINKNNGYRYYSIKHLDQLELILSNKDLGISLSDIKNSMESDDLNEYKALVIKQEILIKQKIEVLKRLEKKINERKKSIDYIISYENEYEIKNLKPININYKLFCFDNIKELLEKNRYEDYIKCLDESLERLDVEAYYYNYNIKENKVKILENKLFIREYKENKDLINKYIIEKYPDVIKLNIEGKAIVVKFYGTEEEIDKYLILLNYHFNKSDNNNIFLKFEFYMPKTEKYFVEIILKIDNNIL
ncbi:MAG: MerR family transcriptional regulator [Paraclostridium sp.]